MAKQLRVLFLDGAFHYWLSEVINDRTRGRDHAKQSGIRLCSKMEKRAVLFCAMAGGLSIARILI